MTKASDHAVNFEAVKVSIRQSKDGHVLALAIHPEDIPEALFRSVVGQRYMVALVALDETERPIPSAALEKSRSHGFPVDDDVAYAVRLCQDPVFQEWIVESGLALVADERHAALALKHLIGVQSRKDIGSDENIRSRFHRVVERYMREITTKGEVR